MQITVNGSELHSQALSAVVLSEISVQYCNWFSRVFYLYFGILVVNHFENLEVRSEIFNKLVNSKVHFRGF